MSQYKINLDEVETTMASPRARAIELYKKSEDDDACVEDFIPEARAELDE